MKGVGVAKEFVTGKEKNSNVIDTLRSKYPVSFLCKVMDINRSGYYKWKRRKGNSNRYEQNRILLTQLLEFIPRQESIDTRSREKRA